MKRIDLAQLLCQVIGQTVKINQSSSGFLLTVEYLFIAITHRSNLTQIELVSWI